MPLELLGDDDLGRLAFNEQGLLPAVVQDAATGTVLMLAYMNRESLQRTLESGTTWFYSRSRGELWPKGATSGHYQRVLRILFDCDADALLVQVDQEGVACHEGEFSCFHFPLARTGTDRPELTRVLAELQALIKERRRERPEGSYTAYLFNSGLDKILKKVGEEASEVIIAAKNHNRDELTYETADLCYHLMVLLTEAGLELGDIASELARRR